MTTKDTLPFLYFNLITADTDRELNRRQQFIVLTVNDFKSELTSGWLM